MKQVVTITPQWQVHIPLKVRELLELNTPGKAELEVTKKGILIKPKKSKLVNLAAKYEGVQPIDKLDIDNIRDHIDYSKR